MNLNDLLTQLASDPTVVHYHLIGMENDGLVRRYVFWQQRNGVLTTVIVLILVLNFGQPNEEATMYNPDILDVSTPFKDEILTALPAYLTAHPEIEAYVFDSIDEKNEIAIATTYEYDSTNDRVERKRKVIYRKDGSLTVRDFLASREIINEYVKSLIGL